MPGAFSPAFFISGGKLRELSLFIDESGNDGLKDEHYPKTDQDKLRLFGLSAHENTTILLHQNARFLLPLLACRTILLPYSISGNRNEDVPKLVHF